MTEGISGKIRISIQDDNETGSRSLLITGASPYTENLAHQLKLMGLHARVLGQILIANGLVEETSSGCYAEFEDYSCQHQTMLDATRHALRRLMVLLHEYGIEPQVGDESSEGSFIERPASRLDYYTSAARLN